MQVAVDEGKGPAVLLLHGQPGTADDWRPVRPHLRAQGFRLLAVNRPGYSGDPTQAGGFELNAGNVVALLDTLGLDDAFLVGHSWGAGVALLAAVRSPSRVRGLLLLAPVGSPLAVTAVDRALARPVVGRLTAALAGPHLAGPIARITGSPAAVVELRRALREWRRIGAWTAFRREQAELVATNAELARAAGNVQAPTTVVHGRHDGVVPVAAGRDLASRIPGARYVETAGGHLLPAEEPELVARLLGELVDRG